MRRHMFFTVVLSLLVAAWVTGCSGVPTVTAPREEPRSAETRIVPETPGKAIELPTPTPEPQRGPPTMIPEPGAGAAGVEPPAEAEEVVRLAREDLARRLGLAPEAIRLISVETVDWSDTSLGCPQPGMMYAQVITPGFLLVLEAQGERYEYHTDQERGVVLCEEGSSSGRVTKREAVSREPMIPNPQDPFLSEMASKVKENLARRLSIQMEQIKPPEVREVTWSDSSHLVTSKFISERAARVGSQRPQNP